MSLIWSYLSSSSAIKHSQGLESKLKKPCRCFGMCSPNWYISHRRVSETSLRAVCPFLKHHTGKLSYPQSITEFRNELVSQWASPVAQTVKNLPAVQETQVQSLGWEDSLEKGMATHSSILDCKIPWTEEPGRLQSMGLQRVRHDWALTHTHTHTHTQTHTHAHTQCPSGW